MEKKKIRKLIISSFGDLLGINVAVVLDDDEWDYCIYDNRDDKYTSYDKLKEYAPDFAICKSINDKWMFLVGEFSDGKTKNGEVVEGPSTDYVESKEYNSLYDTLKGLMIAIFSANLNHRFMEFEMSLRNDAEGN